MARPRKTGLDYFPFDCDFFSDERIVVLAGEFGIKGEIVAVKLLCAIYHNGYFALWNEPLKFKLTHLCQGTTPELIDQIVSRLVRWDFFDKDLFDSAKVLTSVEIQEKYFLASRKRVNGGELPYLLISPPGASQERQRKAAGSEQGPQEDIPTETAVSGTENKTSGVSGAETHVSAEKIPVSGGKMPQIKEDKRKENYSRKNSRERVKKNAASGVCLPHSPEEVEEYFKSKDFHSSAELFFNYYQSRGWSIKGSCITDWKALAFAWNKREKKDPDPPATQKSDDTLMQEIKKSDARRAKEAAAEKAREAKENPDGLTPAQSLALWRARNGVSSEQSIVDCLESATSK